MKAVTSLLMLLLLLSSAGRRDVLSEAFSLGSVSTRSAASNTNIVAACSSTWGRHGSFVSSAGRLLSTRKAAAVSSRSTPLSMVFDRMSDECVAAVKEAHDLGNELGLQVLRTEILFAGMVAKPERAAQTLKRYEIDLDGVKEAAIRTLKYKADVEMNGPNPTKDPLSFSEDSRVLLNKAMQIAERMESETLRSEHVLLSLMGYNNGKPIETVPVMEVLGDIPSLKQKNRKDFSVTKFCDDLVNALPFTPVADGEDLVVRDQVVIGNRNGGNTNTLSEVGVDMTQLALDGKLDFVFGRDKEIRTALRTLGRRRKNNPCLIGDPGME